MSTDLKRPEDILLHLVQDGCTATGRILAHARSLGDSVDAVRREAFKDGLLVAAGMICQECGNEGTFVEMWKSIHMPEEQWYHYYIGADGNHNHTYDCRVPRIHDLIADQAV